ncbi:MAG: 4-(cytidine 5'-diphospho)-2-C-methyl-D-erythritol kinase [Gemmatimonadetes bacterium]|nr:4-(cytidine 5'-diphospho)-2-C-methyl-D-erythritol kinase [Gemmatimonadota bacterium]
MIGRSLRLRAPAKINLGLRVLGVLDDGTHSVETIYQAVDLFDDVELALGGDGIRISVHGQEREGVPESAENLAARAAAALLGALGSSAGVGIRLTKRIPVGSGLGGGSSDAAAVLYGLALLVGRGVSPETVTAVAGTLGADVPFFLRGATAFGYHRGSNLLILPPLTDLPGLVVVPDVRVSTFWAYNAWDLRRGAPASNSAGRPLRFNPDLEELARCRNDFETIVFAKFPEIESVQRTLAEGQPVLARLSGTGAACFALYREASHRDAEAERLHDVYRNRTGYGIFRVRLFSGGVEVLA